MGLFSSCLQSKSIALGFFFSCVQTCSEVFFSPFGSWLPIMVLFLLFLASLLLTLKWTRFSPSFPHFLVFSQISPLFSFSSIQIASQISIFSSCLSWFPDSSSRLILHPQVLYTSMQIWWDPPPDRSDTPSIVIFLGPAALCLPDVSSSLSFSVLPTQSLVVCSLPFPAFTSTEMLSLIDSTLV